MLFTVFSAYLTQLENISSRNEMVLVLAKMFRELKTEETSEAMYLMTGRVAPFFLPVEFSFSTKLILRALAELAGKPVEGINTAYKKMGDIGEFAAAACKDKPESRFTLSQVFTQLQEIAFCSGNNSQSEKQRIYLELIKAAGPAEVKYITRILTGNMRLGLSTKTILDGISWAVAGDKSLRPQVEYAYGVSVDLGLIATLALSKGKEALTKIQAHPGIPVASKLVEREKSAEAIIKRLGNCYIQPKFDGLRVQIHYSKTGFHDLKQIRTADQGMFGAAGGVEKVRIFSRNLENLTAMFPDVVIAVQKLKVDAVILDGEAVGFDENTEAFMPFQETIKRKRKYKVDELSVSVPLQVNLFDVLAYNGQDLLREPIEARMRILEKIFGKDAYTKPQGLFKLAETTLVSSAAELEQLFNKYTALNLEGIIAKDDATEYKPGTRNFDWIKLKASSKLELVDTIDAVVLGYYYGTGARARFGIGAILIGLYDRNTDSYVSLTKVGTGFKDADWAKIKSVLDPLIIKKLPQDVSINKLLMPDVLVEPKIVVVVEADSISQSKLHGEKDAAGDNVGLSLRFPRIKVFGRDKNPDDATTVKELRQMYSFQQEDFGKPAPAV